MKKIAELSKRNINYVNNILDDSEKSEILAELYSKALKISLDSFNNHYLQINFCGLSGYDILDNCNVGDILLSEGEGNKKEYYLLAEKKKSYIYGGTYFNSYILTINN